LGSGSARGWAHIGIIEALSEAGIEPDIVCGTSIGALVGAAFVSGRLEALKERVQDIGWRDIARLLDVHLSGGGLVDGRRIVALLHELGIDMPIEDCAKPFAAVATDLETGREIWLREGPIDRAVRASISIPGIFSPSSIDDKWLVDGGLVNPVPVSTCRALGADVVIAVNLNDDIIMRFNGNAPRLTPAQAGAGSSPEFLRHLLDQLPPPLRREADAIAPQLLGAGQEAPGYFEVLINSLNIMQNLITRSRLAGDPPHVMLAPRLRSIRLLEFNRAPDAIAAGRVCVEEALVQLRRLL
jgi:NTE family protein